ncbi:Sideroflexin-2 [Branchiostoma belcheri]|nr:Sideroflexin-2 [Branchiostoma belcheri]
MTASSEMPRIDLDRPRWDQSTFIGRLKHFANLTDMRTVLSSDAKLTKPEIWSQITGSTPPGTTEEQLWYAKKLYDSAFHPDSGELQNVIGRMSFQVPGGMLITGFMLQFYRTVPAVVFWQWINQSFNALVNYTNRNAASAITTKYTDWYGIRQAPTAAAVAVSVGLNSLTARAPQLLQRYVPFAAVAAGNFANIPLMRQELMNGIVITDGNGNELGKSKSKAAKKGIFQVFVSRVSMAAPGMLLCPVIMQKMERYTWMQRIQFLHAPIQVMLVGCFSLAVEKLEPDLKASIQEKYGDKIKTVYFNKGL